MECQMVSTNTLSRTAKENFRRDIVQLLDSIPLEQWDDPDICGVLYEFVPWHRSSSVTLQTDNDKPGDIAAWKYYYSTQSDGSVLEDQHQAYHNEQANKRLVYHKLLIEAAEALLCIDFSKYNNPLLPERVRSLRYWTAINEDFCLNKTFLLQVYDPDESFRFNYCEYAMSRRLERSSADKMNA